jgi:hypothetical protein
MDENDLILVFDKVLIPWENVLIHNNVESANTFYAYSGFTHRFALQGCTRFAVKLDFLAGLLLKSVEMTGTEGFRGVQTQVGGALAWRSLFRATTDSTVNNLQPWEEGTVLPSLDARRRLSHRGHQGLSEDPVVAPGHVGLGFVLVAAVIMGAAPDPAVELEAPGMIGAYERALARHRFAEQARTPVGADIVEDADGAALLPNQDHRAAGHVRGSRIADVWNIAGVAGEGPGARELTTSQIEPSRPM